MESKAICIIEDEVDIAESVKTFMEASGYTVHTFNSAEEYFDNPLENFVGVYLIDWNLPGRSGLEVVKEIRVEDKISPIFVISANSQRQDILEGLKSGADDYITKPFSFPELAAKVDNASAKFQVVLNRSELDDFRLLPEAKAFMKEGKTVNLTSREFVIFEYLVNKSGEPVTRDDLITCFANDEKMTNRNIDVHIFSLRKKLRAVDMQIETVWGKGYKLVEPV